MLPKRRRGVTGSRANPERKQTVLAAEHGISPLLPCLDFRPCDAASLLENVLNSVDIITAVSFGFRDRYFRELDFSFFSRIPF